MNRTLPALALAALVLAPALAPSATAIEVPDALPFPDDYARVARAWIGEARAELDAQGDSEWARSVASDIDAAQAYADDGRVRASTLKLANARVAMRFHPLWEDASAAGSESARRARVLAAADAMRAEAARAESSFRAALHALDGNLSSVASLEAALLAADWATDGVYALSAFQPFREEAATGELDASLTLGLVSVTIGAAIAFEYAEDLVPLAAAREGVEPRILPEKWRNLTYAARAAADVPQSPPATAPYDALTRATNATSEDLLGVASFFGSLRSQRVAGVQTMFGDAATRGLGAMSDLSDNINTSLAKSVLPTWRAAGYEGLATLDGTDLALYLRDTPDPTLAEYARAWIAVEHPRTVATVLAQVSSERREVETADEGEPAEGNGGAFVPIALAGVGVAIAGALVWVGRGAKK